MEIRPTIIKHLSCRHATECATDGSLCLSSSYVCTWLVVMLESSFSCTILIIIMFIPEFNEHSLVKAATRFIP